MLDVCKNKIILRLFSHWARSLCTMPEHAYICTQSITVDGSMH